MRKKRTIKYVDNLRWGAAFCVVLSIIFNAITTRNVLVYHDTSERMDVLSQRISVLKEKFESEKESEKAILKNEDATMQTRESSAEIISLDEIQSMQDIAEEAQDKEAEGKVDFDLDIEGILQNTQWVDGQWAVSVRDLREGTVYGWNEEVPMQAASVIKVFIMAAVYERVCYPADESSAIYVPEQYEGELKELLTNMITVSDNSAANRLVELLGNGDFQAGKEVVNSFCQTSGYEKTHLGRRFMEENPQDDNYTTAEDCQKILYDLYNGNCVCEEASGKMLAMLQNQTVKTKIPSGLPAGVLSANKTGEMPNGYGLGCIENDIAIVYGEQRDYVICILANELDGKNEEARERIIEISSQVYEKIQ